MTKKTKNVPIISDASSDPRIDKAEAAKIARTKRDAQRLANAYADVHEAEETHRKVFEEVLGAPALSPHVMLDPWFKVAYVAALTERGVHIDPDVNEVGIWRAP